jgi:hypothetical protein
MVMKHRVQVDICKNGNSSTRTYVHQDTAIMMFFKKIVEVHGYIGVKSNSKTFL